MAAWLTALHWILVVQKQSLINRVYRRSCEPRPYPAQWDPRCAWRWTGKGLGTTWDKLLSSPRAFFWPPREGNCKFNSLQQRPVNFKGPRAAAGRQTCSWPEVHWEFWAQLCAIRLCRMQDFSYFKPLPTSFQTIPKQWTQSPRPRERKAIVSNW